MKNVKIEKGVCAIFEGKFWGVQDSGPGYEHIDFGDFSKALIADPKCCTRPTDLTWDPKNTLGYNPHYNMLLKAELVSVERITTIEFKIT